VGSVAGWMALGLPHRSGLCGSAGVTAGMASLAACSTQTSDVASPAACSTEGAETLVRPYTARHWVTQRAVGKGGQGRLESRPHIGRDMEGTEKANHSAAEPQPNRYGDIKNLRARKRIYGLAGLYSKAEQCSGNALILGEFTWAGGYYRRGVLRRLSRPSASARLCWTRVCFDKTVATRGGPFSPCGG